MAVRLTVREAQGWAEGTKFTFVEPFSEDQLSQLEQIEEEVISRLQNAYDTTGWVDNTSTPKLVRTAIAKKFVAWAYRKAYSESLSDSDAAYALSLEANAELIIKGIIDGTVEIPSLPPTNVGPVFYPTDASSAMDPTDDDPSLGPSKFSMSMVF